MPSGPVKHRNPKIAKTATNRNVTMQASCALLSVALAADKVTETRFRFGFLLGIWFRHHKETRSGALTSSVNFDDRGTGGLLLLRPRHPRLEPFPGWISR